MSDIKAAHIFVTIGLSCSSSSVHSLLMGFFFLSQAITPSSFTQLTAQYIARAEAAVANGEDPHILSKDLHFKPEVLGSVKSIFIITL